MCFIHASCQSHFPYYLYFYFKGQFLSTEILLRLTTGIVKFMEEYFNRHKKIWQYIGKNEGPDDDIEFDFVCSDQSEHLAIFMSYNRGYIPSIIKDSFEKYTKMIYHIDHLPINDIDLENPRGIPAKEFLSQGFFVYDNGSVSRGLGLNDYVKYGLPRYPLNLNESFWKEYREIIPMLDLNFKEYDLIENFEEFVL